MPEEVTVKEDGMSICSAIVMNIDGNQCWGAIPELVSTRCSVAMVYNRYAVIQKVFIVPGGELLDCLQLCLGNPVKIDAVYSKDWEEKF